MCCAVARGVILDIQKIRLVILHFYLKMKSQ
jgi:hypothetical protein